MRFAPRRPLGRTGFVASRIGQGDVADAAVPLDAGVATVRRALDAGVNLVDTAPNYENGRSERILAQALRGRRDGVFVITKIDHLHAEVAPQLDGSLQRLEQERVDLLVFHACSTRADLDRLTRPGGGFDQLAAEVRRGRARFVGISSHDPEVLLAALAADVCDVVMFPLGPFVDRRYETEVLPAARATGAGTVCFKTFGAGKLVADTLGYQQPLPAGAGSLPRLTVAECVRYTLTLDPDVALLGLGDAGEQDAAFAAALAFEPMTDRELAALRERAALAVAGKGPCWWNPSP
ncbi:MAG: aldo/keto reductase [Planctomycetota bacterium]